MSHVVVANYGVNNVTEFFQPIWKLTRALLAAGWRYKASADATGTSTNKDTSANPANDKWAVGGATNYAQVGAQTGTAPVIGAASAGLSTITSVSGFTANSVGRFLVVTGAANAANNGAFRITAQTGTTVTVFNPGAVAETSSSACTWKEVQGGAGASVTTSGTGGATPGRAIVSGLSGMVSPTASPLNRGSVGDHLTIIGANTGANNGTFRITRVISASSVEIDNASAVTDANNGSIVWVESSPLLQTYPVSLQGGTGAGAWIVLQGASTMKIPISTNVPTGAFLRGEKVTQSTSGATGTIIGVMTDTGGGTGFLVIMPRLNGGGSGPRGWTSGSTDTITGAVSGATITSSTGAPVEYVREIVIWKNSQNDGHLYVQCVDQSGEATSRFSSVAGNAGVTNVLAPGSVATFPTPGSWVMLGTGNTAGVGTGPARWYHLGNLLVQAGNGQLLCANCMEDSNNDADGSWIAALGSPSNTGGIGASWMYAGMFYMRLDGSEDGDIDPYITCQNFTGSAYGGNRLGPSAAPTLLQDFFIGTNFLATSTSSATVYAGWRRRGFSSGDAWQQFHGMTLTTGLLSSVDQANIGRVQSALQEYLVKDALWVVSTQSAARMRKGYLRWIWMTEGGVSNNTYLGGTWVQLSEAASSGPLVCGPWDGASIPSNA